MGVDILSSLKLKIFYGATFVVIAALTYIEWIIPSESSLMFRLAIVIAAFIYWASGTSVFLYSPHHASINCLALNVVGLMFVLSTSVVMLYGALWMILASQTFAICVPPLLIRSYHIFNSKTIKWSRLTRSFDLLTIIMVGATYLQFFFTKQIAFLSTFIIFCVGIELTLALVVLFYLWRKETIQSIRNQIRGHFVGSLLQFIVLFVLYYTHNTMSLAWVLSSIILPFSFSISILRGRLMDVELHRSFVYVLLTTVLTGTYMTILIVIGHFLDNRNQIIFALVVVSILSMTFVPMVRLSYHATDFIVYRDHYDFRGLLRQMESNITLFKDADKLGKYICIHLTEALNLKWCAIISMFNLKPELIYSTGSVEFPLSTEIISSSSSTRRIPLKINNRKIGEIVLATKRSHIKLRSIDEDLLKTIAYQTAVALDNYRLVDSLNARVKSLKEAEEDRRLLRRRLMQSEEEARANLSRDLHDGALQSLFHLIRLCDVNTGDERIRILLEEIAELGRDITFELRQVCSDLRPHVLDQLHFPRAVECLIEWYQEHYEIDINLQIMEVFSGLHQHLRKDIEVILYRVIQEALSNVLKHANASQVNMTLRYEPTSLYLSIVDDGVGFSIKEQDLIPLSEKGHMGIIGMFERVGSHNGTICITKGTEKGTEISIFIPYVQ